MLHASWHVSSFLAVAVILSMVPPCQAYRYWTETGDLVCRPRYPGRAVAARPSKDSEACLDMCKEHTGEEPCSAAVFLNNECTLYPGGCLVPAVLPQDYVPGAVLHRAVCENAAANDIPYTTVMGRDSDCDCEESCEQDPRCRFWQRDVPTGECGLYDTDTLAALRVMAPVEMRYGIKGCWGMGDMCPIPVLPTPSPPTPAPPTPAAVPATPSPPTPAPPTPAPPPPTTPTPALPTPAPDTPSPTSAPRSQAPVDGPLPDGNTTAPGPSQPANGTEPEGEEEEGLALHTMEAAEPLGQAAAVASLLGSSPDAVRVLLANEECNVGVGKKVHEKVGWMVHPTQVLLSGGGHLPTDVVIGNSVLCCVLGALGAIAACIFGSLAHKIFPRCIPPNLDKWGAVRFPGFPMFAFLFLSAGTSLGSAILLFEGPKREHRFLGVVGFLVIVLIPILWVRHAWRSVPRYAVYYQDETTVGRKLRFFIGSGEWCSRQVDPNWVDRYFVVRPYRQGVLWFLVVDCVSTMLISAAQGAEPGTWRGCGHVKMTTAVVFLLLAGAYIVVKPFARQWDNLTQVCALVLQFFSTLLMAVGYYLKDRHHWAFSAAACLVLVVSALLVVRTLIHAGCELYVFFTDRRERLAQALLETVPSESELTQHLKVEGARHDDTDSQLGRDEKDHPRENQTSASTDGKGSDCETEVGDLVKTTSSANALLPPSHPGHLLVADASDPMLAHHPTSPPLMTYPSRRRSPSPRLGRSDSARHAELMRPPVRSSSRASSYSGRPTESPMMRTSSIASKTSWRSSVVPV